MYGFPYIDLEGKYGISNRDNYVIVGRTQYDFVQLCGFLSTPFVRYLFEATRYRMKYLEKYIFELLPDITLLCDFPKMITNQSMMNYFDLDDMERTYIQKRVETTQYNI